MNDAGSGRAGTFESGPLAIVPVGYLGRPYGVRGWNHVHSTMDPVTALLGQSDWWLTRLAVGPGGQVREPTAHTPWQCHRVETVRQHGAGLVGRMARCETREAAEAMRGMTIGLTREALPPLDEDEYYWVDLLGAQVVHTGGAVFGTVQEFLETGAHDVMVVAGERERLIPFLVGETIREVDVAGARVVVNWDPSY